MVCYECPRCEYSTDRKSRMQDHLHKKKLCEAIHDIELTSELCTMILDKKKHKTLYNIINDNSSHVDNSKRINNIKHNDNSSRKTDNSIQKNDNSSHKTDNSIHNSDNKTDNSIDNSTHTTIHNHFTLNPFGHENIDGIDLNTELKDVKTIMQLFKTFVDILHFRREENYNISVSDKVRKNLMIYEKPPVYTSVGEAGYFKICHNILHLLYNNASIDPQLRENLLNLLHETVECSDEDIVLHHAAYNKNEKRIRSKLNDQIYDHTRANAECYRNLKKQVAALRTIPSSSIGQQL